MRLIDADAIIEKLRAISRRVFGTDDIPAYSSMSTAFIDEAPTVDAVPVVRCRECIEFVKYRSAKGGLCKNTGCCTSEDFYCADGKRKGGDE